MKRNNPFNHRSPQSGSRISYIVRDPAIPAYGATDGIWYFDNWLSLRAFLLEHYAGCEVDCEWSGDWDDIQEWPTERHGWDAGDIRWLVKSDDKMVLIGRWWNDEESEWHDVEQFKVEDLPEADE